MSNAAIDKFLLFVFRTLVVIIVAVALYVSAYFSIDVKNYILVHSMTPTKPVFFTDEKVSFDVDREVFSDYPGGYHVTLRYPNGRFYCTSGVVDLPYNKLERATRFWEISNWAAGPGGCNGQKIKNSIMEPGEYIKTVCHRVYRLFFPVREHCWDPVRWAVVDPENPPEFIQRSLEPVQDQVDSLEQELKQLKAQ